MSSISDKIICLGKRHDLEDQKMRLLGALVDINNITFDNVDLVAENQDSDAVRHFKNWVQRNRVLAGTDEVVANVDAGLAMVDLSKSSYSQVQNLTSQLRQTILAASTALTDNEVANYRNDALSYYNQIKAIYTNTEYNDLVLHDHSLNGTEGNFNSLTNTDLANIHHVGPNNIDGNVFYCESGYTVGLLLEDLNISIRSNTVGEYELVSVTDSGTLNDVSNAYDWRVGMCFTIKGSSLGGVDNVNDCTISIKSLNAASSSNDNAWGVSDVSLEGSGVINKKSYLIQVGLREHVRSSNQIVLDFSVPSSLATLKTKVNAMVNNATAMDAKQSADNFLQDVTNAVSKNLMNYTRLVESRNKVLRDYRDVFRQLETQRSQAKGQINGELANIMKTISYLNVCISHNGH